MTAARFELINLQEGTFERFRPQGQVYLHGMIRQGHTERGQLLGANVGVGAAAGSTLAVDHYWPTGKWTASWTRDLNRERGDFHVSGVTDPLSMDVSHSLGFEMTRFVRGFDVTTGLTLVRDFNRDYSVDASNINAIVGVRYVTEHPYETLDVPRMERIASAGRSTAHPACAGRGRRSTRSAIATLRSPPPAPW